MNDMVLVPTHGVGTYSWCGCLLPFEKIGTTAGNDMEFPRILHAE